MPINDLTLIMEAAPSMRGGRKPQEMLKFSSLVTREIEPFPVGFWIQQEFLSSGPLEAAAEGRRAEQGGGHKCPSGGFGHKRHLQVDLSVVVSQITFTNLAP